jgi:hypothetical protein
MSRSFLHDDKSTFYCLNDYLCVMSVINKKMFESLYENNITSDEFASCVGQWNTAANFNLCEVD